MGRWVYVFFRVDEGMHRRMRELSSRQRPACALVREAVLLRIYKKDSSLRKNKKAAVKLTQNELRRLEEEAAKRGISRSELLRCYLRGYLECNPVRKFLVKILRGLWWRLKQ